MKVLFIYTNIDTSEAPHFVNGIGALSAYLKQAGHKTDLLFIDELPLKKIFRQQVAKISPDVIGISTGTNQWRYAEKLAGMLARWYSGTVVCGGIHATLSPEEVIETSGIDIVCIGEGEEALLELLAAVESGSTITGIPNLWVKQDGQVVRNPPRPLTEDLDSLPFPDRDIFDYPYLLNRYPLTATLLMSGRGCPYRCPYCLNHALAKVYRGKGKYTRLRSPKRVCDEIEMLNQKWGMDDVLIYDDTFTYDRQWVLDFAVEYGRRFRFPFSINVRPETVDDAMLVTLRNAGLKRIMVGVEAGNERIRKEVLKRQISDELLLWLFDRARELGIQTWANTMMGIPGETVDNLEETTEFIRRLAPDHAQVMVFYPYPGTDLGDLCRDKGYITKKNVVSTFAGDSVLNLPTVSQREIKKAVERFAWEALRGRVERQSLGDVDLLSLYLDLPRDQSLKPLQAAEINRDNRIGIPAHLPSEIRFQVTVQMGDVLHVGLALDPQVWDLRTEATGFQIQERANGQMETLLDEVIDPGSIADHRCWVDRSIPLTNEGKMELIFRTESTGSNNDYGWALWGHPYIERAT